MYPPVLNRIVTSSLNGNTFTFKHQICQRRLWLWCPDIDLTLYPPILVCILRNKRVHTKGNNYNRTLKCHMFECNLILGIRYIQSFPDCGVRTLALYPLVLVSVLHNKWGRIRELTILESRIEFECEFLYLHVLDTSMVSGKKQLRLSLNVNTFNFMHQVCPGRPWLWSPKIDVVSTDTRLYILHN